MSDGRSKLRAKHPDDMKRLRQRVVSATLELDEYAKVFALAEKTQQSFNATLRDLILSGLVKEEK